VALASSINYPAIIVRNLDESVQFYARLGLRPLYREPNRDDAESAVVLLAFEDGDTFLQLVGPARPGTVSIAEASPGAGSMQYLALHITLDGMRQIWDEMSRAGLHGSEVIERGYERLVFLEDPDGVLITLTAWGIEPPSTLPRAAVLQRAAALREAAGAPFIEDHHIAQAIEALEAIEATEARAAAGHD